jgi:hypothetical protein
MFTFTFVEQNRVKAIGLILNLGVLIGVIANNLIYDVRLQISLDHKNRLEIHLPNIDTVAGLLKFCIGFFIF